MIFDDIEVFWICWLIVVDCWLLKHVNNL